MPLSQIPPWLDVKPSDFVKAAQMGAETGLSVAKMNQAAFEAAQNRAQRGAELDAELELKRFERQMQMELRAQEMADRRQQHQEDLAATTAYHMGNLSLRDREISARAALAKESQAYRQRAEARYQQNAQVAADREKRLAAKQLSPEVQAQVKLLLEDYRTLNDQKKFETDEAKIAEITATQQGIKQQILDLMPKGEPAPGAGIPSPEGATLPAWAAGGGSQFTPGMSFIPDVMGGEAPPPMAAPAPPVAPAAMPSPDMPAMAPAEGDTSGWKTNRLGIRYRMAAPTPQANVAPVQVAAPVEQGLPEPPIWPDEEEDPFADEEGQ